MQVYTVSHSHLRALRVILFCFFSIQAPSTPLLVPPDLPPLLGSRAPSAVTMNRAPPTRAAPLS